MQSSMFLLTFFLGKLIGAESKCSHFVSIKFLVDNRPRLVYCYAQQKSFCSIATTTQCIKAIKLRYFVCTVSEPV